MLSFEAPAMEAMGLIQRWRDQAGEERRAKGLKVSAEKKKKWCRGRSGLAGVNTPFMPALDPMFSLTSNIRM